MWNWEIVQNVYVYNMHSSLVHALQSVITVCTWNAFLSANKQWMSSVPLIHSIPFHRHVVDPLHRPSSLHSHMEWGQFREHLHPGPTIKVPINAIHEPIECDPTKHNPSENSCSIRHIRNPPVIIIIINILLKSHKI